MENNKLKEKSHSLNSRYEELADAINELNNEVKQVYKENKKLQEENTVLKQKLAYFTRIEEQKEVSLQKEEVPIEVIQEEVIDPVFKSEKPELDDTDKSAVLLEKDVVSDTEETIINVSNKQADKKKAIFEFFLGKNVIAKIATLLIFLGIVTFGQIAYNEFNTVGKSLLILFAGIVSILIGLFAERKKQYVFSNVFYALGVLIIYYANMLTYDSFELYSIHVANYLSIVIIIGSFLFFRSKRYEFLDVVLFMIYTFASLFALSSLEGNGISVYFESILFLLVYGYFVYYYFTKYYELNGKMKTIFILVVTILASIMQFIIISRVNESGYPVVLAVLYTLSLLVLVYFINFLFKYEKSSSYEISMPFATLILSGVTAAAITNHINFIFNVELYSYGFLFAAVILIPIYIYSYKVDELRKKLSPAYYLVIIFALLIFTLSLNDTAGEIVPYQFRNIVFAVLLLMLYALNRYTRDHLHQMGALLFIFINVIANFAIYFTSSFEITTSMQYISLVTSILLIVIYELFKRKKESNDETENAILHTVNLIMLSILTTSIVYTFISTDMAFIFAILIFTIIGYRWLIEINYLEVAKKHYLMLTYNIALIILLFLLNIIYFDHDFTKFTDVLKVFILFLVNGYIVLALREIYRTFISDEDKPSEIGFVMMYLLGVLLHSLYITNYFNFEFDKVILSSYFLIASAVGVLFGFRYYWKSARLIGLGAIYFSLLKFFVYDFFNQDFTLVVRMVTYLLLGFILLGISFLYSYLEKTYGKEE